MRSIFERLVLLFFYSGLCVASYREQYRVPQASFDNWESYVYDNREYIIQNLPVTWENANILCSGHYNGTLAVLDTREKAEFLAEALSESRFDIDSIWVGARRESPEDPAGYRWLDGVDLRRTVLDILPDEDGDPGRKYPMWLNRSMVPVPPGGAECVALERVSHDRPVLLDLPCLLRRPFVCERESRPQMKVLELKAVRCLTGLYKIFSGRLEWKPAAAYCLLRNMTLANIGTMRCLKKLGTAMLKTRPSKQSRLSDRFSSTTPCTFRIGIESAWIGASGALGRWSWADTGLSILRAPPHCDTEHWPPMRDRTTIKQNGCLALDRHTSHSPVFMEARCERRMEFICQQASAPSMLRSAQLPSDDTHYYILVRQQYFWQHAFENCLRMNGSLADPDNQETLMLLLLLMGEDRDYPINHIWLSGRLNATRDAATNALALAWYNPANGRRIPDNYFGPSTGLYVPPWLEEEASTDSPCLNLDRQAHLRGLLYGLPCNTPQHSVCLVEKSLLDGAAATETISEKILSN